MFRIVSCCVLMIGLALASTGFAQEDKPELTQDQMMEMVMKLAGPSEEHKILESLVGEWNTDVALWMAPGIEPMRFNGETTNEMILGGRFLLSQGHSGEGDMYTETLWILGFDRRHEYYTLIGMDTWGTYHITSVGEYDAKTKILTMSGEVDDPLLGMERFRTVLHFEGAGKYTVEMIMLDTAPGVEEFKMLELVHTRK